MQKTYSSSHMYSQDAPQTSDLQAGGQSIEEKSGGRGSRGLNLPVNLLLKVKVPDKITSAVIDGTLPALTLLSLTLMIDLLIYPIQAAARVEGLFVYFFIILALGIYSLDRCTAPRKSEPTRALWGMAAGLFLWHAIWLIQLFADFDFETPGPLLILLVVTMVGLTLWRPVLPLGVKFFLLAFLASWYNRILVIQILDLSASGMVPPGIFYLVGFLALVIALVCIGYLVHKAEFQIQRYWAALVLWQVSLIGLSVAFGALL